MKERCLIKTFSDVNKFAKLLKHQIRFYGPIELTFEFEDKPKKTLHDRIEERYPDNITTFADAKKGLQLLAHDIASYYRNTKIKNPNNLIVRTLSTAQIIAVVLFLIASIGGTIWLMYLLLW